MKLVTLQLKLKMILLFVLILSMSSLKAQDINSIKKSTTTYKLLIPKLDVLIDSAWAKHGLLKSRKAAVNVKVYNLESAKRIWTKNFGVQADSRYGTFANFSEEVTSAATINLASNTTQFNYGFGVFLKLPVFDIYNRKNQIQLARAEIEQAENLVEFQKFEIRDMVIRQHQDLLLKQSLLEVTAKNLINAKVISQTADNEYRNGLITIYEYVRLSDITARIEVDYETAKSNFLLSKRILENLTGLQFN